MKSTLYFVILSFKPDLSLLKKNLSFLSSERVCVVDNSADEEIKKSLITHVKRPVHLIVNEKNLGYAGGMNVGMKYAFGEGADWVVLLNDDVELSKEAVTKLHQTIETQQPGIFGPYGGYLDKNRWTTILKIPKSKIQIPNIKDAIDQTPQVDYISGSFFVLHKKVYELVQGFYPDYFMYYEDVDVCIQATKKGFPLAQVDIPNIHHQEGKSIERGSNLHEYYLSRNHLLFVERQAPMLIKLREGIRLPKTIWEHKFFMNRGGLRGVTDFLFVRYGKGPNLH